MWRSGRDGGGDGRTGGARFALRDCSSFQCTDAGTTWIKPLD